MTNPYAPPQASVRDIAEPHAKTVPAEASQRLLAAIVDTLIFSVMVYLPMGLGVAVAAALSSGSDNADSGGLLVVLMVVPLILGLAVWLWMTIKQIRATGQSLGKKYCKIKVVRSDGSPITLSRLIWLRNVVNGLISIVPLYGLIDVLFIFGASRTCLHDKLADTIVIKA